MSEKKYVYCNVLPENYQQPYLYIADMDVKAGDIVVISIKHQSKETQKVGLVLDVNTYTEANAPYPVQYTKHIKRIFSEEDAKDKDLAGQKARLEAQNAHLMLSEEQKDKKDIKESLLKQGFHRNEVAQTNLYLQNLIRNMADTARSSNVSAELAGGVILSNDGKTVVEYSARQNKAKGVIKIPAGVEIIEDGVFAKAKFDKLVLNKELRELGKYTLNSPGGPDGYYRKDIAAIEVEPGSKYFYADDVAFYSIEEDGTKSLICLFKKDIEEYIAPSDVSAILEDAFAHCRNLKRIVLSESVRFFDENSLSNMTEVRSVYLPKGVTDIRTKGNHSQWYQTWNTVEFIIDEDNEHLFVEGDCIYQILPQGGYKLISCRYYGKGQPQIIDGTYEIGEEAFYGCNGFSKINFPTSVKVIGRRAFCHCNFKTITIPETVQRIEAGAFSCCNELKKICINHELEYVAEDAFSGCSWDLQKISSSTKQPLYSFKNGEIRNLSEKKSAPQPSQIMKKIADELNGWTFSNSTTEKAVYDSNTNTISLNFELDLRSDDAALVKERVECAETLKVNDQVFVRVPDVSKWEIISKNGKSVGQLNFLFVRQMWVWFNMVRVESATISKVTPKSQRKGAKYALVSIKMVLAPNELDSNASEEEKKLRTQFAYSVDDNEARVLQWIGSDEDKSATIPSMIGGKKVKRLLPGVFRGDFNINPCNIEELIVSEGVERLENESIFGLSKLKKVVLPKTINYISPDAFSQIDNNGEFRDLYLNEDMVFVAPAGSYAEKYLREYKPQTYLDSLCVVNSDSKDAQSELNYQKIFEFKRYDGGFEATFKDGWKLDGFHEEIVKAPEQYNGQPVVSFDISSRPSFVKKIILPATVEKLANIDTTVMYYTGRGAEHCLDEIEVDDNNPYFWSDGRAIYSKDKKILYRLLSYSLTEYTVQPTTEVIEKFAFGELVNLVCVTLSPNVIEIKEHAFNGCRSLTTINGMENVKKLGDGLFNAYGWDSSEVPYLKNTAVIISGCNLIKYHETKSKLYTVPDGIEMIDANAFSVEDESDCLEEIVIPDSVTTIRSGAFLRREALRKVTLSNNLKELEANTFACCIALEELTIPASVEKIDTSAFPSHGYFSDADVAFRAINVEQGNPNYCSVNGMLLSKDKKVLYYVPGQVDLGVTPIPFEVEEVAPNACKYNVNTINLNLPDKVKTIGKSAFYGFKKLKKLQMSNSVLRIEESAFGSCSKLSSIVWSENLEHVDKGAFADSALKKATLPKSVKSVGCGVFYGCKDIEVYDGIDPDGISCEDAIDTINGQPNSNVGCIGVYSALGQWYDHTITVRSVQTGEIKYAVWMGTDRTQRHYYCQLASSWGKNATFSFKDLDEFFPKIRGTEHKVKVAKLRLEYPVALSDEMKKKYESYLSRYGKEA